ncbi:PREDICTED: p21-activated protein kinase-interacting protein 1-like [Elephantulus edwardii]|uniref:p21-activated protein kinase-interacting protein 1-like n=1 Tax=Elephantulus edwardii TaxID=28737 RepID=UPI0003F07D05|nr:PREDICTED: p21-activated protein kinase-interacting protein 1-like [Elephantulus edwardii]
MELVAGCYEQVLFGFSVHRKPETSGGLEKWTAVADFTHHAHTASVSAVAVNSRFVVTGKYIVVTVNKIDIYQLDTASISGAITNQRRISSVTFLSESVLGVAGDEEVIRFFDCDSLICLCEFKAHENRVKDILAFEIPEHHVIVSASNDGFLKMWKLHQDKKVSPSLLCEVNTKARLTCLGVWLDRVTDTKESLPGATEPSVVSKEEQPPVNQKGLGNEVQEEGGQPRPNAKKSCLAGHQGLQKKGNSLVSPKKRTMAKALENKRKKKKI